MYRARLCAGYRASGETKVIDVCTLCECAYEIVVYAVDDIAVTVERTLELCRCRVVAVCHRTGLLYSDIILQEELCILTVAWNADRIIRSRLADHPARQGNLLLTCAHCIHELLECLHVSHILHIYTWFSKRRLNRST